MIRVVLIMIRAVLRSFRVCLRARQRVSEILEILLCQHPPRATALQQEEVSNREISASDHPSLKSPPLRAETRDLRIEPHAVREAPRAIMKRQAQEVSDQRGDVFLVLQEASADAEERNIPESVVMQ